MIERTKCIVEMYGDEKKITKILEELKNITEYYCIDHSKNKECYIVPMKSKGEDFKKKMKSFSFDKKVEIKTNYSEADVLIMDKNKNVLSLVLEGINCAPYGYLKELFEKNKMSGFYEEVALMQDFSITSNFKEGKLTESCFDNYSSELKKTMNRWIKNLKQEIKIRKKES